MKIGVFSVLFSGLPFEEALDKIAGYGLEAVEIGTGNYPGTAHCDPDKLLADPSALKHFKEAISQRGLTLSALSCHGNPLHPDPAFAQAHHETWKKTVLLAEKLGIEVVCAFSGCPGDSPGARYPNWVTCAWPPDYQKILDWQWNEVVIPYWQREAAFAREHNVRVAFEMHPGFVVYNPESLLRLREAAGENLGANFDPSHLYWQGIDPIAAIRLLGKAIYHVHAKDTRMDAWNMAQNGVLDVKSLSQIPQRSWVFRSVGYGHPVEHWKDLVSALRMVGYDYVLSIEHEDALASIEEGLLKAIGCLKEAVLREPPTTAWWA